MGYVAVDSDGDGKVEYTFYDDNDNLEWDQGEDGWIENPYDDYDGYYWPTPNEEGDYDNYPFDDTDGDGFPDWWEWDRDYDGYADGMPYREE